MAGLVRQQERSVAGERAVTAAGTALVGATSRDDIYRAAMSGSGSLLDSTGSALLCIVDGDEAVVVAGLGEVAPAGNALSVATVRALADAASDPQGVVFELGADEREDLGLASQSAHVLVLGLALRGETSGLLVAAGPPAALRTVRSGLRALATQVSLALESAALTEEIHQRAGEARFGSLIKHSSHLVTVLDADARVVYQSPSVETRPRLGRRRDRGHPLRLAAHPRRGKPPAAPAGRRRLRCARQHRGARLRPAPP
jgi:hypothetical protein